MIANVNDNAGGRAKKLSVTTESLSADGGRDAVKLTEKARLAKIAAIRKSLRGKVVKSEPV